MAKAQAIGKKKRKKFTKNQWYLLGLVSPFILFMIIFSYIPLAGWALAFMNYKPGIPLSKTPFVGLQNFEYIFMFSDDVLNALKNTLIMSFLGILTSVLPVIFAIMLTEIPARKYTKLVQTVTTIPNFISWVIVFSFTFSLFSRDGAVNMLLMNLGLISEPTNVLANNDAVWYFQTALGIWKGLGWSSIIYFAAIAGIDPELYNAATVDGASRLQKIWYITIPSIGETYLVLLLMSVCNMLSNGLDQYLVFYNALVAEHIEVLDYFIYRVGIKEADYSFSTAVGILKSGVSILMLFVVNGISKKIRGYTIV